MNNFIDFFSTPYGVALSSLVGISGFVYALFQKTKTIKLSNEIITQNNKITLLETRNIELNQKLISISNSNDELKIINSQLANTVNNLENGDVNHIRQPVVQTGKNNVNNGDIDGNVSLSFS